MTTSKTVYSYHNALRDIIKEQNKAIPFGLKNTFYYDQTIEIKDLYIRVNDELTTLRKLKATPERIKLINSLSLLQHKYHTTFYPNNKD